MKFLLLTPIEAFSFQVIPDLGLMYIAAALRQAGFTVAIRDFRRRHTDFAALPGILRAEAPDVVGIKCYTHETDRVKRMAAAVKQTLPQAAVIVGGPHASMDPASLLAPDSGIDYVFVGEAERSVVGFARWLGSAQPGAVPDGIPGLAYRGRDGISVTPPEFEPDLDAIPLPAWDMMPPEKYPNEAAGMFVSEFPAAPMMLSRGCPFACTYCGGSRVMGKRIRHRSVENILREIDLLERDHGVKTFTFVDDNFTMDREKALRLFSALADRPRRIAFTFPNGVRASTLDEEMVRLMERAGCQYVALGIESGSDDTLRRMRKSQTVAEVREKVALIRRVSGIKVVGFFILGYPGEKIADVQETIRFAAALPIHHPHFCIFNPIPGTPAYEECLKQGLIGSAGLRPDQQTFDHLPIMLSGLSPRRVRFLHQYAYLRFYLTPWRMWSLLRDIRSPGHLWGILRRAIKLFW